MKQVEIKINIAVPDWWNDEDIARRTKELFPPLEAALANLRISNPTWWNDTGKLTLPTKSE